MCKFQRESKICNLGVNNAKSEYRNYKNNDYNDDNNDNENNKNKMFSQLV